MVQQLFNQANGLDSMRPVLSSVFSDGVMSWGRIASVLALGAVVCEQLKQDHVQELAEECVDTVASHISTYLSTDLQLWLINNNGWVSTVVILVQNTHTHAHTTSTVLLCVYMYVFEYLLLYRYVCDHMCISLCVTGWFCGVLSC